MGPSTNVGSGVASRGLRVQARQSARASRMPARRRAFERSLRRVLRRSAGTLARWHAGTLGTAASTAARASLARIEARRAVSSACAVQTRGASAGETARDNQDHHRSRAMGTLRIGVGFVGTLIVGVMFALAACGE